MTFPDSVDVMGKTYLPKPLPVIHQYYQVKWDWQSQYCNYTIRDLKGRPSTVCVFRCGDLENNLNGHYTRLNKEWQFFTFDLLCMSYYKTTHTQLSDVEYDWIAARWKGLYDGSTAFTNGQGTDTTRNYITRKKDDMNMDADKDLAIYTLVCGGASINGTITNNTKQVKMIRMESFDGNNPPPSILAIDIYHDPRVFFATSIYDIKVNGGYRVRPLTYLTNPVNGEVHDVPIPIISTKPVYYPLHETKYVLADNKMSPYYP